MINITSGKPPCTGKRRVWHQTWMIMRLTAFLIIISTLTISAKSYSQKVSLSLQNVPVEQVFRQIREQTGYSFLWTQQTLKDLPPVSVSIHGVSLKDAVKASLEGLPLTYGIRGNVVYIERKIVPPLYINPNIPPPILPLNVIIGLVTDSTGSPLPGVTVYVQNSKDIGTTTDENGRYVLKVPDNATLVFSMVGFQEQDISATGKTVINVMLRPAKNELGETVIVGFGKQKKENVVGAITTIDPKELKTPSSNLTTALAGRLAGLIAYQRSGEPGEDNADFFIRGVATFGQNNKPLILIDNVEVTSTDLARLQPDDIASFSILKDATATAVYGAKGANGVLLITTKQGVEGKPKYSVRLENSISSPTRNVQFADPVTYMKDANEAVLTRNPLGLIPYSRGKIENTLSGGNPYVYPATDWMSTLLKKQTVNQRANVNISGGGQTARYYVSGSFNQDNGLLKVPKVNNFNNNINLKTYSIRTNVEVKLSRSTKLSALISGTFDDYNGPISGGAAVYNEIVHTDPVRFPAYYLPDSANILTKHILFGNDGDGGYNNPYADMVKGYRTYSSSTINAQLNLDQDLSIITKGLRLRAMANTVRYGYFSQTRAYQPFYYSIDQYDRLTDTYTLKALNPTTATEYLGYSEGGKTNTASVYIQAILDYHRTFSEKHAVGVMLVGLMKNNIAGNAGSLQQSLPHRNLGLSGRLTYAYKGRYFGEFDFGYNGSERFDKEHRFGFFPSVGAAWNISKEKFWQALSSTVSNLKLRATYGIIGNDAIGSSADRFFYLSSVNPEDGSKGAEFGSTSDGYSLPGYSISRYANPDVTWEKAYKTDLGIDMSLFNNVTIAADYFHQYRKNILMTRSYIPSFIGLYAPVKANVGEAVSQGIDASVNYSQQINNNFWIKEMANFTYATSAYKVASEPNYADKYRSLVGYSLSQPRGYLAERLFVNDKEVANSPKQNFGTYGGGDIKYMDVNKDGKITEADQIPIGFPTTPEIVYGFGASMGCKGFDFSFFFQGLARESFFIDPTSTAPFQGQTQLLKVYADSHWSEVNQDIYALWPRLSSDVNQNDTQKSTWWMRNGKFLRLKQVEIGYSLSQNLLKRWHMNSVRIYLNSTNVLTFSQFKLWDVEMGGEGLGYPIQRVVNMGVQLSF